jgi:threonylcarbamoyladenosine tRNA methylthiotransferase MtaB
VKARARWLREATARRKAAWLQDQIGSRQKVLVESESGGGHAENFAPVRVAGAPIGEIVNVRIEAVDQDVLIGVAE